MRSWSTLWICGVGLFLRALSPLGFGAPIDESVRDTLAGAIRWQAYWEGAESLGSKYQAGKQIEARALQSQARMYIFLAPIEMEVDMTKRPDGRVASVGITSLTDVTNADAVASFLAMRAAAGTDCMGAISPESAYSTERSQHTDKTLPLVRPCPPEEKVHDDETFTLVLPQLTPPAAIQKKTLPPDSNILVAAVRRYLDSRRSYCVEMNASIPFYSDTDPRVYVFLQSQGACPKGVATFSRSTKGEWEFGKFFVDVPKEQMSGIIAHIKSNTARTVNP